MTKTKKNINTELKTAGSRLVSEFSHDPIKAINGFALPASKITMLRASIWFPAEEFRMVLAVKRLLINPLSRHTYKANT